MWHTIERLEICQRYGSMYILAIYKITNVSVSLNEVSLNLQVNPDVLVSQWISVKGETNEITHSWSNVIWTYWKRGKTVSTCAPVSRAGQKFRAGMHDDIGMSSVTVNKGFKRSIWALAQKWICLLLQADKMTLYVHVTWTQSAKMSWKKIGISDIGINPELCIITLAHKCQSVAAKGNTQPEAWNRFHKYVQKWFNPL